MKPTLPLKKWGTYRTNKGDIITFMNKYEIANKFFSEEIGLYFNLNELRAPCTSCEIVEELSQDLTDIRPSSLTHEEMMQRLEILVEDLKHE